MSSRPVYIDFSIAGLATSASCLFTNPFEVCSAAHTHNGLSTSDWALKVVKTRMQLQNELVKQGGNQ